MIEDIHFHTCLFGPVLWNPVELAPRSNIFILINWFKIRTLAGHEQIKIKVAPINLHTAFKASVESL